MRKHAVPLLGVAVALAVMLSVWGCAASPEVVRTTTATAKPAAPPPKPGPVPVSLTPTRQLRPSPDLLALGKRVYEKQCVACHGLDGSGEGEAAYLLYPKPRDFVAAKYVLVSTWDRVPTDEDLFRTISRGMPGSAMPSWGHLTEEERWGLVHYVKSFAQEPWVVKPPADPKSDGEAGTGVIRVPPEPPFTPEARARALERYADACASCHGTTAKGDGVTNQTDDKGYPTRPRDLTLGVFKGSPEPAHMYRRIVSGMPGTPMPMSDWAYGEDAWHLVHLVRSWSSDEQRARVEMRKFTIGARRVDRLPDHPDAGTWRLAQPVNLHLMPVWWRADRPEELTVRALHDGKEIALLLVWSDATDDHTAMRPQEFRDAVAVEFSLTPDPPFFAMGAKGQFVNIWMWKSERQADLEPAFQELEKVYPNLGIDSYPNPELSPLEQPTRHALTLQSAPTFVTAWGARNIVPAPTRASAVPVAFAVGNGSAGDRDGKKSVTIWQDLYTEP